jgi:hypothetical protein
MRRRNIIPLTETILLTVFLQQRTQPLLFTCATVVVVYSMKARHCQPGGECGMLALNSEIVHTTAAQSYLP